MPPTSTSRAAGSTGRQVLGEVNDKANQTLTPKPSPSGCKSVSSSKEPEHIDLTSDPAPGFSIISGGSASIGETVDGRPLAGSMGALGSNTSRKRKSDGPAEQEIDLDDFDCGGMLIDKNPDQVRRQIRRFLDNGGMKVGEFCNAIGVSNNAYNRFMQQSGRTKGTGSDVFTGAWGFFTKREMAGLKMPTKKQKTDNAGGSGTKGSAKAANVDISGVHLSGEEDDAVPVYDTCDEIRKKITAHLGKQGVTKAQFCRDLYAQLHSSNAPTKIQGSQLDRFRGNKGPSNGCTSSVFYAAYVFFEKHRIAEGKAKSKHRQEMEGIWPNGMDRNHDGSRG